MKTTEETIKVYIPDDGKAIKLTLKGKVVMYMIAPYYALPSYKYDVEEVDIDEANKFYGKSSNFKKLAKMFV